MFQKPTVVSKLPLNFLQGFAFLAVEFHLFFNFCTIASAFVLQNLFSVIVLIQESIKKKFLALDLKQALILDLYFGLIS